MNELIKINQITINGVKINSVNARHLWEKLKSKQDFLTWIKRRLDDTQATENFDYIRFHEKMEANNATKAVIDPRYGRINTYSTEILKQIF
ncbi:antA/AntB antirepressor family protein [Campylobacter sp. faydin G-105]|uniref:antA/AntB antirepressor family protein n=1 Tax=Campylobacter anatolicus TaxID=2829105 RepID=UPI001B99EFA6|nr:antA/AntB antirepressor family protein [Campylobacter anatolicus]MBR8461519.1 antA/AntB antirepressor family protein [Campylobacter anatolicus]